MSEATFNPILMLTDEEDCDVVRLTTEQRQYPPSPCLRMVPICEIDTGFQGAVGSENTAYAQLFAAAPELYRLLAKVERVFTLDEQGEPLPDDRDGQAWITEVRAALAQARGEQS